MTYWVLRLASWLLVRVHEAVGFPICAWFGRIYYFLVPARRKLLERNLRVVFGPEKSDGEIASCARKVFAAMAQNYFTLFHMGWRRVAGWC
jgi:lauroyl/myristoyl acyltransferase